MFRSRFSRTAVSMLAAALLGVLTVGGCGDDDDDNGRDNRLVNAPGEAWVATTPISNPMKFYANGAWEGLSPVNDEEAWYIGATGTWTTSGNRLTISYGITQNMSYSMPDNNTLNVSNEQLSATFIRTSNVIVVDNY